MLILPWTAPDAVAGLAAATDVQTNAIAVKAANFFMPVLLQKASWNWTSNTRFKVRPASLRKTR